MDSANGYAYMAVRTGMVEPRCWLAGIVHGLAAYYKVLCVVAGSGGEWMSRPC